MATGGAPSTAVDQPVKLKRPDLQTMVPRTLPKTDFDDAQCRAILSYARAVVEACVNRTPMTSILPPEIGEAPAFGVFVALKRGSALRACRGRWGHEGSTLGGLLMHVARDAAVRDHRFPSITPVELMMLGVDVSLMFEPTVVHAAGEDRINAFEVGKHGLILAHPRGRGLLLPHVALENGWDAKTLLDRVCTKAKLPPDTWRRDADAQLMTFRARLIENFPPEKELDVASLNSDHLNQLLQVADRLLREGQVQAKVDPALTQPHFEPLGLYVGTEAGQTAAALGSGKSLVDLVQVAVKSLAQTFANNGTTPQPVTRLTLLWQPIRLVPEDYPHRHRGLARHALLARNSERWTLVLPASSGSTDRVRQVLKAMGFKRLRQWPDTRTAVTAFSSLHFEARRPPGSITMRTPARAGQFYPADPAPIAGALDGHFARAGEHEKSAFRAVMLPHAGWKFCGDTAAKVLARTAVPPTVIVIGPKHTPLGPNLSVPPHQAWEIPGIAGGVPIATTLARRLLELVPDFKCEPDAHRMEHGTEVLLPFLNRCRPGVTVLPVVIGQVSYPDTTRIAAALAAMVAESDKPILLVISSDMNHFAPEPENRRRDTLALDAMITGDPRKLFNVCRENDISMCGLLPAVIVMQALQAKSPYIRPRLIDYTNSAAASGDASSVVGYAGVVID